MISQRMKTLATLGGIGLLALGSAACAYDNYGDHHGGRWDRHGERHDGRGDRNDHRGDRGDRDHRGGPDRNDGRGH